MMVCAVRHTVVRAGIYASTPASLADHDLVVRGRGGSGRTAFVAHEDIAAVIVALTLDATHDHEGAVLEVTGPEALTLAEEIEQVALASGRPYRYEPETPEEAFDRRYRLGLSGEQIEAWLSWYQAIDWWPPPGRAS